MVSMGLIRRHPPAGNQPMWIASPQRLLEYDFSMNIIKHNITLYNPFSIAAAGLDALVYLSVFVLVPVCHFLSLLQTSISLIWSLWWSDTFFTILSIARLWLFALISYNLLMNSIDPARSGNVIWRCVGYIWCFKSKNTVEKVILAKASS